MAQYKAPKNIVKIIRAMDPTMLNVIFEYYKPLRPLTDFSPKVLKSIIPADIEDFRLYYIMTFALCFDRCAAYSKTYFTDGYRDIIAKELEISLHNVSKLFDTAKSQYKNNRSFHASVDRYVEALRDPKANEMFLRRFKHSHNAQLAKIEDQDHNDNFVDAFISDGWSLSDELCEAVIQEIQNPHRYSTK